MHEKFIQANAHAFKEKQIIEFMISIIKDNNRDTRYITGSIPFKNLNYLTDRILVLGNPNHYYGVYLKQLNYQIQSKLDNQIVPSI